MMQVRVLLFGMLKDLAGRDQEMLSLPEGSTIADVLAKYEERHPRLRELIPSIAASLNQQYACASAPLRDQDEIALLPPVSGGAEQGPLVRLQRERIVPHDIIPSLERPQDGAIVIFDGVVRNHSRGRRTLYLDYEAYEPMALKMMQQLAQDALARFQVRSAAIVHRLGRLQIGESSVLIAVFAPHRAAAFEACRWLIDTLKQTIPIWKKEYFEDGAVWAPGEPFPEEMGIHACRSGRRETAGAGLSAVPEVPPQAVSK